jgi:formylglycine-generating enzyme required for sulfatase activity
MAGRRCGIVVAACALAMLAACSSGEGRSPSPLGSRASCSAYGGLPAGWGRDPHAGMVRIEGGSFQLGSERGYDEERPLAAMRVAAFWIDRTEVTNAQFAAFVAATGYATDAERRPGAAVFRMDAAQPFAPGSWWHLVEGADWRHPDGPGSDIGGRGHEPVVDVTYADAQAYAHWLGRALPTEAQWEYAAKAGRDDATSDRALRDADGRPQANFWQGNFPVWDRGEDGYAGRAPVGCFAPNPDGLHDMVGNVWEWTIDLYRDNHAAESTLAARESALPARSGAQRRTIKGGSYLCSADYCVRARASSRQGEEEDLPAVHLGFRTVAADS